MKRILFDIMRGVLKVLPRGRTFVINSSLKVLGNYYGGIITAEGRKFWIEEINSLNRSLFFLGIYEPNATKIVKQIVKPGMHVCDVGSNFGWYTLLLAQLVGPNGRVYAFDISETLIATLTRNVELNHFKNVLITQIALGDNEKSVIYFNDYKNGTANLSEKMLESHEKKIVSMTRLDQFIFDHHIYRVDFIKCDIDGGESAFINGAKTTLAKKPPLLIEIWGYAQKQFESSGSRLVALLESFGYILLNIDPKYPKILDDIPKNSINVLSIDSKKLSKFEKLFI